MKFTEEELLLKQELREELVARIEVLDKVKGLLLLPTLEMATIKQVADFYEVGIETIKALVFDHRDELLLDGFTTKTGKQIQELNSCFKQPSNIIYKRGYFLMETTNDYVKIAYPSNSLFPKRAILRVGMLLRQSEVAKEVRTQLLNIEEKAPEILKSNDLDTEKQLVLDIMFGETEEIRLKALIDFQKNKNKQIEMKNKIIAEQKPKVDEFNKLISGNIHLTATEIASMYLFKNGLKVDAKTINEILLKEGYIKKYGRNTTMPSEKGVLIGGSSRVISNGHTNFKYTEWTIDAVRKLHEIFIKHNLIGKTETTSTK